MSRTRFKRIVHHGEGPRRQNLARLFRLNREYVGSYPQTRAKRKYKSMRCIPLMAGRLQEPKKIKPLSWRGMSARASTRGNHICRDRPYAAPVQECFGRKLHDYVTTLSDATHEQGYRKEIYCYKRSALHPVGQQEGRLETEKPPAISSAS